MIIKGIAITESDSGVPSSNSNAILNALRNIPTKYNNLPIPLCFFTKFTPLVQQNGPLMEYE